MKTAMLSIALVLAGTAGIAAADTGYELTLEKAVGDNRWGHRPPA